MSRVAAVSMAAFPTHYSRWSAPATSSPSWFVTSTFAKANRFTVSYRSMRYDTVTTSPVKTG